MKVLDQLIKNSDSKTQLIDNVRSEKGLEFLNTGNDRVVVSVSNNQVAKLELTPRQNKKEKKTFSENEKLEDFLLPINNSSPDMKWVTYPMVLFDVQRHKKINFLNDLVSEYCVFPKDLRLDDIGRHKDKLVICDYGFGFRDVDSTSVNVENLLESHI